MRKIQLITRDGGLLAFVEIPEPRDDGEMPEVVLWKDHILLRKCPHPDDPAIWVYREATTSLSFTKG